jgi:hypothetical protein
MPRKRRVAKRRPALPAGLSQITLCERSWWSSSGPLIGDDEPILSGYHVWPDWRSFMAFYSAVRDEWCADRPWLRGMVERQNDAWLAGEDPASVAPSPDPRLLRGL